MEEQQPPPPAVAADDQQATDAAADAAAAAAAAAPIDGTQAARAIAAATRQAAKRKHEEVVAPAEQQAAGSKKGKAAAAALKKRVSTSTHMVARPAGWVPGWQPGEAEGIDPAINGTLEAPVYEGTPAKQYPFTLDTFQQTAIACLERRESVMVAAHTSAGKTVVAEYAIAMAFRDRQRVVYTSPLKALSNQKYRELEAEFGDVGLMTGDVTINPNANCIVMTTEILRSMIYRGSELMREVAWVIFDEVHYMQDRERGVVWEEIIISVPHDTKMVFLSATLDNAGEFAAWVSMLHKQPCHVVYTDFRPTPLEHFVCPVGGGGLYKVMSDKGFNEALFQRMRDELEAAREAAAQKAAKGGNNGDDTDAGGRGGGRRGGGGRGRGRGRVNKRAQKAESLQKHLIKLLSTLQSRKLTPIIVFSFSKRECETYATAAANPDDGNLNFATPAEAEAIEVVYNNMLQVLSPEDQALPALGHMLRILRRGFGVHHGGLLPILKELVEMLFSEGLIKVLFTTETFAMGLNMPARSVVFTALKKFDGTDERMINSGEYIQMSGRAGRRGKDDRGTVIVCADEDLDLATCQELMSGKPKPLQSSFKLSYYTLLNLLKRAEGGIDSLEHVIRNSFNQFQQESERPQKEEEVRKLEARSAELQVEGQAAISEYKALRQQLAAASAVVASALHQPDRVLAFLRPGRLVRVKEGGNDWGWGIVVSVLRQAPAKQNGAAAAAGDGDDGSGADNYIVDTLLPCKAGSIQAEHVEPAPVGSSSSSDAELGVIGVALKAVSELSSLRVSLPSDLKPADVRANLLLVLENIMARYPQGVPLLDPVQDMGIDEPEFLQAVSEVSRLEQQLAQNPVFQTERDRERFALFAEKARVDEEIDRLKAELNGSALASFQREAKARIAVLEKLGFVDKEGIVTMKGRAACEIDTTDELLSTELMLNGTFSNLDKHQLLALISCLVDCDKTNDEIKLTTTLAAPLQQLQNAARAIAAATRDAGLECDDDAYIESFRPSLMDVFYNWSLGKSFAEVAEMTEIYEGSIIRVARRLDELMQQLETAARAVGNEDMAKRLEESNATLKRGIMFSASLYL